MQQVQYSHLVSMAKDLVLEILPSVFVNFRDLCLPWIPTLAGPLTALSHEALLKSADLDTQFKILDLCKQLLRWYGIGALPIISQVAF